MTGRLQSWQSACGTSIKWYSLIVPFLAIGVVESAGLAVAASLGVVPVVPSGGTLGGRGLRGVRHLLTFRLVFGV